MSPAGLIALAAFCSTACALGSSGSRTQEWPWFNASLPQETRLHLLVDAMSTTELITQLVKFSQPIGRLGVPGYAWHMEAAHGVQTTGDATVFPCSLARAAAFDPAAEERIARAIGVEVCRQVGVYNDDHKQNAFSPTYTIYI